MCSKRPPQSTTYNNILKNIIKPVFYKNNLYFMISFLFNISIRMILRSCFRLFWKAEGTKSKISLLDFDSIIEKLFEINWIEIEKREELDRFSIDIRLLLRTLDAAGDENQLPPEVFAPFSRFLRKNSVCLMANGARKKMRQLRFAFHAGEDFAHIVTGIRRIDEIIKFMDYEKCDRLGHALAIGIDPLKWLKEKSEIIIPKHELLDNYVWLWNKSIEMTPVFPNASNWTDFYSHKALLLVRELYPSISEGAALIDYYKAWLFRRNHPHFIDKNMRALRADFVPDFVDEYSLNKQSMAYKIYELYLYDEDLRRNGNQTVLMRYDHFFRYHNQDNINSYEITEEEALFWTAIQDFMLQECSDTGIIIEANPSSNIYISEFDRYYQHPIFRWHPVQDKLLENGKQYNKFGIRKSAVDVCINTDDPGIFSTTLQNEFALLKQSAMDQFPFGHEEISRWLEKLRQKGIKDFF